MRLLPLILLIPTGSRAFAASSIFAFSSGVAASSTELVFSQTILPVPASAHCNVSGSEQKNSIPFISTGEALLLAGSGVDQTTFFVGDHSVGGVAVG